MNPLILLIAKIFGAFIVLLLLINLTGVVTFSKIETLLEQANSISPYLIASIIIALLIADLFISVPTLSLGVLAGFFLGPFFGAITLFTGLMITGVSGYTLTRLLGFRVLNFLMPKAKDQKSIQMQFHNYGFVMILLSRALPMLPETTACLAGMTKMPISKFLVAWAVCHGIYSIFVSYIGSISSVENPYPTIISILILYVVLGLSWLVFQQLTKQNSNS